jgi:hypothetical protein
MDAQEYGRQAPGHIANHGRNQRWAYATGPTLPKQHCLSLDDAEPSNCRPNHSGDPLAIQPLQVKLGRTHSIES